MKQGNVEIILPKEEVVTICFTQVGMMENGEFVLEFPFEKSGINLNTLRTAQQLEAAAKKLGLKIIDMPEAIRASEDFGFYTKQIHNEWVVAAIRKPS